MADEFTSRHIEGPGTGAGMVGDASGMMRYVRGAPGATTADALAALDLPAAESYVTLVSGEVVRAAERAGRRRAEDDTLVVLPPIEGG